MAKLFPGMVTTPNTVTAKLELTNSLALAIDEEFNKALAEFSGITPPVETAADRQLLFLAIARGLLKYLKAKTADLETDAAQPAGHKHKLSLNIDMDTP